MLPWFIYLLIELGYLQTAEQWFTLSITDQQYLKYIIDTIVM